MIKLLFHRETPGFSPFAIKDEGTETDSIIEIQPETNVNKNSGCIAGSVEQTENKKYSTSEKKA